MRHDLSFALSTFVVLIVRKSARMQRPHKKQNPRKQMLQMTLEIEVILPMPIN